MRRTSFLYFSVVSLVITACANSPPVSPTLIEAAQTPTTTPIESPTESASVSMTTSPTTQPAPTITPALATSTPSPTSSPSSISEPTATVTDSSPTATPTEQSLQGAWRQGQAMIAPPRSEMPAVTLGDWVYVPGGFGGESRLDRFDPVADQWQALAGMPAGRHHLMATAYADYVYILGGAEGGSWNPTNTIWRYDPATNT